MKILLAHNHYGAYAQGGEATVFNQERAGVRNRSEVQPRTAQKQPAVNNGDLLTESNPTELRTDNRQANSSAEPETRGNSDFFQPQTSETRTREPEPRHTVPTDIYRCGVANLTSGRTYMKQV